MNYTKRTASYAALNLRIERLRELLARLNQLLSTTGRMRNESSSTTRDRRTEAHIGLSTSGLSHSDRPGMQAIVGGDGVHKPATNINKKRVRSVLETTKSTRALY